jgi:hypothetical protein
MQSYPTPSPEALWQQMNYCYRHRSSPLCEHGGHQILTPALTDTIGHY